MPLPDAGAEVKAEAYGYADFYTPQTPKLQLKCRLKNLRKTGHSSKYNMLLHSQTDNQVGGHPYKRACFACFTAGRNTGQRVIKLAPMTQQSVAIFSFQVRHHIPQTHLLFCRTTHLPSKQDPTQIMMQSVRFRAEQALLLSMGNRFTSAKTLPISNK